LVNNISADQTFDKITTIAVRALLQSLPFAAQNFKVQGERDYIMTKVFEALTSKDEDIRVSAM
jgi:hypothetical protein